MCQRVMIAIALALKPKLLIADEPTTALDVTIQAQVLEVMRTLTREAGTALILITHDLGVVAAMAQRVNVMYAGRIVETGTPTDIFARPRHPYTVGPAAFDRAARTATPPAHSRPSPGSRPTQRTSDGVPVRAPLCLAARRVRQRGAVAAKPMPLTRARDSRATTRSTATEAAPAVRCVRPPSREPARERRRAPAGPRPACALHRGKVNVRAVDGVDMEIGRGRDARAWSASRAAGRAPSARRSFA